MAKKKFDDSCIQPIWERYWQSGRSDTAARNQLIEFYFPLTKPFARTIGRELFWGAIAEIKDLQSAGVVGLKDAIHSFRPERGVRFATYSALRIRGSMLDWLRACDWVPRTARQRSTKLGTVSDYLYATLGHEPSSEELQKELGVTPSVYADSYKQLPLVVSTHDRADDVHDQDTFSLKNIVDRREPKPDQNVERESWWQKALSGLDQREREVLILYYHEQLSFREIGSALGFSESRANQLHTAVIQRLRASAHLKQDLE